MIGNAGGMNEEREEKEWSAGFYVDFQFVWIWSFLFIPILVFSYIRTYG